MRDLDNIFLEQRIHELEKNGTGGSSADKISYNNSESGLTSNNVQGAIDEVHEEVENIRHHYSTDEKIVGEWIDGSTIYEKTYSLDYGVPSTSAFDLTGFSASDYGLIMNSIIIRTGNNQDACLPVTVWKSDNKLRCKAIDSLAKEANTNMYLILQYSKNE